MGVLILSLETILNDGLLNCQSLTAINAFRDRLNNSDLHNFLDKCDTMKLLK